MPQKGSCLSWLQLRIKPQAHNLAQLQVSILISTSQPCIQGVVLLCSWLHFRACFCWLLPAQALLTCPACILLALSNHISVAFLVPSLYLEWPGSWTLWTFHNFQISLWNPSVPLHSSQTLHWPVWSISFCSLNLGHSCLIQDAPNFTLWRLKLPLY